MICDRKNKATKYSDRKNRSAKLSDLQKRLFNAQIDAIGYERYLVRAVWYWQPNGKRRVSYFIDVFTSTGLLIKTKFNHLRINEVENFVEGVENELSSVDV